MNDQGSVFTGPAWSCAPWSACYSMPMRAHGSVPSSPWQARILDYPIAAIVFILAASHIWRKVRELRRGDIQG